MTIAEIIQLILGILTLMTLCLMGFQFHLQKKDYNNRFFMDRNKLSIEQAKWFANKINEMTFFIRLSEMKNVKDFLNNSGITNEIITNVNFDSTELNNILSKKHYNNISNFEIEYKNELFKEPIEVIRQIVALNIDVENRDQLLKVLENIKNKKIDEEANSQLRLIAEKIYYDLSLKILNEFEAFAMYFSTGVANDEIVFSSLHQAYIRYIRSQYIEISKRNLNNTDKYYVNIINLYNDWSDKREHISQQEKEGNMAKHKISKKKF